MKNKIINRMLFIGFCLVIFSACSKKLDLFPQNDLTYEKVYSTPAGFKSVLAKIYATLAITGNQGPSGQPDISGGLDEGSQVAFIRGFFNCQELPTDEAVCFWQDQTIKAYHGMSWNSADPFLLGMYARPIYNITLINEYLTQSTDTKLSAAGITGKDAIDIKNSRAEARFLRAFNYWVMLDLFGKSTFITEADGIGTFLPKEISRADLFKYIESELKAIDGELAKAKSIEYGRVDQSATWALLARLYLNAEVYTGVQRYTDALTNANKVIGSGYKLYGNYSNVFMADNDKAKDEFIFTINCDGLKTQAYGNTSFLIHAACGDDISIYGVGGGWKGYRATSALTNLFTDPTGVTDKRALFTNLSSAKILDYTSSANFDNYGGVGVRKFVNLRSDGLPASDVKKDFSDIDFPVFRLSEMYLIYAEAAVRGGGDLVKALEYVNNIRERAYGNKSGNIGSTQLTLDFILDERGRELYWEGHRRTDLIRYKRLTTATYLWPWKGGVENGTSVDDKYNLFPIPAANRTSNTNLTQNIGY